MHLEQGVRMLDHHVTQYEIVQLAQPIHLRHLIAVHLEVHEIVQPLAMSVDRIGELAILPWTAGDDLGSQSLEQLRQVGVSSAEGSLAYLTTVEDEHALVVPLCQHKLPMFRVFKS